MPLLLRNQVAAAANYRLLQMKSERVCACAGYATGKPNA
jgi:hypothetical protein